MNTPESPEILLIDLENCPSQVNGLLDQLDRYASVVICYAQSGAKVPLDWLPALSQALQNQKLRIIHMHRLGKNAADFGISFFAGMLMQQMPAEAQFSIVSNDTDLDHVVHLLQDQGRQAQRIGSPTKLSAAPTTTLTEPPTVSAVEPGTLATTTSTTAAAIKSTPTLGSFCARLIAHPNTRPGKPETLRNALRTHAQQSESLAGHMFQELQREGAIRVEGTKLSYVDRQLAALALLN
jgi:hypothetical protein